MSRWPFVITIPPKLTTTAHAAATHCASWLITKDAQDAAPGEWQDVTRHPDFSDAASMLPARVGGCALCGHCAHTGERVMATPADPELAVLRAIAAHLTAHATDTDMRPGTWARLKVEVNVLRDDAGAFVVSHPRISRA